MFAEHKIIERNVAILRFKNYFKEIKYKNQGLNVTKTQYQRMIKTSSPEIIIDGKSWGKKWRVFKTDTITG